MARFSPEVKVGLFVLAGLLVIAYMSLKVGGPKRAEEQGYNLVALFESASGLKTDTPAEVAGIRVGYVEGIELYEGKAMVTLKIRSGVQLGPDSRAMIRTRGVLGDRFVELIPGVEDEPPLQPGDVIGKTTSQVDVDTLLIQLSSIAEDVKVVTGSLRDAMGGDEGEVALREILENTKNVTRSLNALVERNTENLEQIMVNFRAFSSDMKDLSGVNKENVTALISNVKAASETIEGTLVSLRDIVDKVSRGEGTFGRLLQDESTVDELNETLVSLRDISGKISRGEGTIGKLVNDPGTAETLDETLTRLNAITARADRFRLFVGYRGEYLFSGEDVKSYLNVRIQPTLDKYYLLSIVDDPGGSLSTKTTETVTHLPDGSTTFESMTEKQIDEDELKFSAEIAKRYYDTVIRGGIIESSGGFGLDHYLFDDNLKLTAEAFDFDRDRNPHVKFYVDANLFDHIYLTAGYDDVFSDQSEESFFVGVGLRFEDEDLKYLLTGANIPIP